MKKFLCYDTNDAASGKIGVDSRGMLKPNSTVPSTNGTPYQQLVTDGSGEAKWEDRLAYEGSRLVVEVGVSNRKFNYVKVLDEIPSWVSIDAPIKIWQNNDDSYTDTSESYTDLGNGSFIADMDAAFIAVDNTEFNNEAFSVVFPEKGVYFGRGDNGVCISGIASADSDTPEITWDGDIGVIKKIDEKFLPDDQFVVTFTMSEEGSIAPDKTFDEIFDAYKAGKKVSGVLLNTLNDWTECYVSSVNGDIIDFFAMISSRDDGTIGCHYAVLSVSRIGGTSVITGLLTQAK